MCTKQRFDCNTGVMRGELIEIPGNFVDRSRRVLCQYRIVTIVTKEVGRTSYFSMIVIWKHRLICFGLSSKTIEQVGWNSNEINLTKKLRGVHSVCLHLLLTCCKFLQIDSRVESLSLLHLMVHNFLLKNRQSQTKCANYPKIVR